MNLVNLANTVIAEQPLHGGRLHHASLEFGISASEWIDLSTGINPHCYPLPAVPNFVWQKLPDQGDSLQQVASSYYRSRSLLAVSGSQTVIEILPHLRKPGRVGIVSPAYAEYAYQWQRHGHVVEALTADELEARLPYLDVVVVIRPNNPTAEILSRQRLHNWLSILQSQGGWLVVDEAFLDSMPNNHLLTMINEEPVNGLIVLRSVGKFFGLAGIRLGFVWAEDTLLKTISLLLPVWSVSSVARWAGITALQDSDWQVKMRRMLSIESQRLTAVLQGFHFTCLSTPLFCTVSTNEDHNHSAIEIYTHLAKHGILIRYFEHYQVLRFGLPANEIAWQRLESTLGELKR